MRWYVYFGSIIVQKNKSTQKIMLVVTREDNVSSDTIGRRVVLVDGSRGILSPDNARPPARQRLLS